MIAVVFGLCVPVWSAVGQMGRAEFAFDEGAVVWLAVGERVVISDVPVPGVDGVVEMVSLELTRFAVTRPGTRFVVGQRGGGGGGGDIELYFDPSSVVLLRGSVVGEARLKRD